MIDECLERGRPLVKVRAAERGLVQLVINRGLAIDGKNRRAVAVITVGPARRTRIKFRWAEFAIQRQVVRAAVIVAVRPALCRGLNFCGSRIRGQAGVAEAVDIIPVTA